MSVTCSARVTISETELASILTIMPELLGKVEQLAKKEAFTAELILSTIISTDIESLIM
ncbi:protein of unknown function [Candidatus Nitrosotalea okcheonensis]|uniref:Uncharacterized protein n=1 Tax=Candidatus Nitrosotalea okcheonensis TaxID=1903276 RepID=A0A2H1FHZ4_9ARCH|nr:protein of unknown function [Candidatus Nitrosotalea okcheonensis]